MRGPLHSLFGIRLIGTALGFWLAALGAAVLAVLVGGLAIEAGGTAGTVVLLVFGASILLVFWVILRVRS